MPNSGRTTCFSLTPTKGIEVYSFMETLRAVEKGFSVQTEWLDSEIGAGFAGTIKPNTIVTKWFDALPDYLRQNVAHVAAHQHRGEGLEGLWSMLRMFHKTCINIATTSETNADKLMKLLRALQEGFGVEVMPFNSEHGAILTGTVTPHEIVSQWSNRIPSALDVYIAKISVV